MGGTGDGVGGGGVQGFRQGQERRTDVWCAHMRVKVHLVSPDVEISYWRIDSESISEDIKQLEYVSDFDGDSLRASSCSELQEECRVFFECGVYFSIDYNVCKFLAMQANMKIRAIAQDCSEYSITVAVEKKDCVRWFEKHHWNNH
ncbi:hypothetical protein Tco_0320951 [Tanacetum coccineum]